MGDAENFPDVFLGARSYVLSNLPDNVIALHAKIEAFAQVPVDFLPTSYLHRHQIPTRSVDAAYCDETRAHITVKDADGIDANAVAHELLHIHRYWVDQVPQLDTKDDIGNRVEFMSWLDNALEHLVIVPQERALGFDPSPYWAEQLREIFEKPAQLVKDRVLRNSYIIGWTMTAYCDDDDARNVAADCLRKIGLQRQARLLLEKLGKAQRSKLQMVRHALNALEIPLAEARLITLHIREKRRVVSKILS